MVNEKPSNIDDYIAGFPEDVQKVMQQIRTAIKEVVPHAEEKISYGMPAFNTHGRYLVYFGGFKKHIGFYPTPSGTDTFAKDLEDYKTGRGSVQFPLDRPMPLDLIKRIVAYREKENIEKNKKKK